MDVMINSESSDEEMEGQAPAASADAASRALAVKEIVLKNIRESHARQKNFDKSNAQLMVHCILDQPVTIFSFPSPSFQEFVVD
jgi:hypothetical protein